MHPKVHNLEHFSPFLKKKKKKKENHLIWQKFGIVEFQEKFFYFIFRESLIAEGNTAIIFTSPNGNQPKEDW